MIDRNDCKVACMQTFSAKWLLSKANMSHSWFFDNIVAAGTMKILVDIFSNSAIFVAILLFCRATSYSSHCSFLMDLWVFFISREMRYIPVSCRCNTRKKDGPYYAA